MTPLETYLTQVRDIRNSGGGTNETSYYTALQNLLSEYGKQLKPKVMCVIQLQNQGAGMPDGGLFTQDQYKKASPGQPLCGQMPSRGVIEAKSPKEDVETVAQTEQVKNYLDHYGQVLVTNYRQFLLLGRGENGNARRLEATYTLAASEAEFWNSVVAHPRATAESHGVPFTEFIQRAMLYAAPLAAPSDVAWFLASYARDAKSRVERADLPALTGIRTALEQALGMRFEGEKGEHFFRSTLVQTLFYGLFSAWVLWHKKHPGREHKFNWHEAVWNLKVPMIRALFGQLALPDKLQPLGLEEVMDWATAVLNRVDRGVFFEHFKLGHAVQYFYEPFLEAFDPELRKQLGVWYTPPEIVEYMVARVDTVLREELKIEDGLADERVYVLDPCCGTGAYLVEVLNRIHQTLDAKGIGAMAAHELKKAAIERVFGFEILSAPFVVSHLQLGLLLENLGAPLSERTQERVGVYLTNALTGWEPPKGAKVHLPFPEMEEERDAAERVKRETPIIVILGNPPYNAFAGVSPKEEDGLLLPYKQKLKKWGITKNYIDDLYVRFFRVAERRIAEKSDRGVVCYISNYSWVHDPSYVVVREHLLHSFDEFWIDNLHGNRKISEYAPDGRTSETIFAIPGFSSGIQPGVAISLLVKTGSGSNQKRIRYRDNIDAAKASERRQRLLESLSVVDFNSKYQLAQPTPLNQYLFRPLQIFAEYFSWPTIAELSLIEPLLGLNDNRSQATHDISKDAIAKRMRSYYDPSVNNGEIAALHRGLMTDAAGFDAAATRIRLLKQSGFCDSNIVRFWFKPFDQRWAYLERTANLWNRVRPELLDQAWSGNQFLLTRRHAPKAPDGSACFWSRHISDQHVLHTDAYFIPFWLRLQSNKMNSGQMELTSELEEMKNLANLSKAASEYLGELGAASDHVPLWMHVLAVSYSPFYLSENADGIRQDWPRIPLPNSKEQLLKSAALGRNIAELLDTECPLKGVTSGKLRAEMPVIAVSSGELKAGDDFNMTAGWGHAGKDGVTMPGKGNARERDYTAAEREAIAAGAVALGLTPEQAFAQLGERTCDVFINHKAWWSNIPVNVWKYTIGGYQVIKKWLSYREFEILGRPLKSEEVNEVMNMARRIAAILLMQPELDANYEAVKKDTYDWQAAKESGPKA